METEKNGAVEVKGDETGAASEKDKKSTHRMVETERQPGMMNYPFATHRPPPEGESKGYGREDDNGAETDKTEETNKTPFGGPVSKMLDKDNISIAFVLGVIILVSVMFIGIMFSLQRRQLMELKERINTIETSMEIDIDE